LNVSRDGATTIGGTTWLFCHLEKQNLRSLSTVEPVALLISKTQAFQLMQLISQVSNGATGTNLNILAM